MQVIYYVDGEVEMHTGCPRSHVLSSQRTEGNDFECVREEFLEEI